MNRRNQDYEPDNIYTAKTGNKRQLNSRVKSLERWSCTRVMDDDVETESFLDDLYDFANEEPVINTKRQTCSRCWLVDKTFKSQYSCVTINNRFYSLIVYYC